MSTKIEQIKKDALTRMARLRTNQRRQSLEHALVRHGSGLVTAAALGACRRYGVPPSVAGFPWKVGISALATLGEAMTSGATQAALAGVGAATTAIYVESAIATDSMVAGGDYSPDERVSDPLE